LTKTGKREKIGKILESFHGWAPSISSDSSSEERPLAEKKKRGVPRDVVGEKQACPSRGGAHPALTTQEAGSEKTREGYTNYSRRR